MSKPLPIPVRALLGLAAFAVEEVRKIPDTLPTAAATIPVEAVSAAMQASLKFQQQLASLAAKGDEFLVQLRGNQAEAPSWATFDDESADLPVAAFDRVSDHHLPDDAAEDLGFGEEPGATTVEPASGAAPVKTVAAKKVPAKKVPAKKVPAKKVPAAKVPAMKVPADQVPAKKAAPKKAPGAAKMPPTIAPGTLTTQFDSQAPVELPHEPGE